MKTIPIVSAGLVLLLAGCVADVRLPPPGTGHPAHPEAARARMPSAPASLQNYRSVSVPPESGMVPGEHGIRYGAESPGPAAGFGSEYEPVYLCPSHPDQRSRNPGACPRCGNPMERMEGREK